MRLKESFYNLLINNDVNQSFAKYIFQRRKKIFVIESSEDERRSDTERAKWNERESEIKIEGLDKETERYLQII